MQPICPILGELLHLWPELGFVQIEVIDGADSTDLHSRKRGANTIHQGPAGLTEVVGHGVVVDGRGVLRESGEVVLASQVGDVFVVGREIRCEHGCRDLVAVGAMAHKGAYQTWCLCWLFSFANMSSVSHRFSFLLGHRHLGELGYRLTTLSCTAPQKHVAVASVSVDHPSFANPVRGI